VKKIFVGNLDFGVTEESLRSLFEPYGGVESIRVVADPDTGRSKGFAFVEMAEGDANKAMAALHNTMVSGRALNINEARPKADRAGHNSGGRYREGRGRGPGW
jgi:cold-inducible RNA-binding protein